MDEKLQRPLELTHGHIPVYMKTFELVKHRRVGYVGVTSIDSAWRNDRKRRASFQHSMNLDRRGMGSQEPFSPLDVKGVLHIPGRMVVREIELFEIKLVRLHFRPLLDNETEAGKDVD